MLFNVMLWYVHSSGRLVVIIQDETLLEEV